MTRAIKLAKEAYDDGEIPVGAVVSKDGVIIGEGRNRCEKYLLPTRHAEIEAIENACRNLKTKTLSGCVIYSTLEPCPMCAGAIINARISKAVFGAYEKNFGSLSSVTDLSREKYPTVPETQCGFMEDECSYILTQFFRNLRKENKK